MRLLVITGQTSTGKSDLAVEVAKKLGNCVIVSADSRQLYKELNLLSGKVPCNSQTSPIIFNGIVHYGLNSFSLHDRVTLFDFIHYWIELIPTLNCNTVILTGGTGLYITAILNHYQLKKIPYEVEQKINSLTQLEVVEILNRDFARQFNTLNSSDIHNPRRQASLLKKLYSNRVETVYPEFDQVVSICLIKPQVKLERDMLVRINNRIEQGMIDECYDLFNLLPKLLTLGLEPTYTCWLLLGFLTKNEYIEQLFVATKTYAKKQTVWNKKQGYSEVETLEQVLELIN
jgi:tRNA dimethylallyltransferase